MHYIQVWIDNGTSKDKTFSVLYEFEAEYTIGKNNNVIWERIHLRSKLTPDGRVALNKPMSAEEFDKMARKEGDDIRIKDFEEAAIDHAIEEKVLDEYWQEFWDSKGSQ